MCLESVSGEIILSVCTARTIGWIDPKYACVHQTISQRNYCIKKHEEICYTTVVELSHLAWNGGASSLVQNIHKYITNVVVRDLYCFQLQKELT